MKELTLIQACIDFFGLRDGQSRMDFMRDEYKKLTPEDRKHLIPGLEKNGYKIVSGADTPAPQK